MKPEEVTPPFSSSCCPNPPLKARRKGLPRRSPEPFDVAQDHGPVEGAKAGGFTYNGIRHPLPSFIRLTKESSPGCHSPV